MIKYKSDWYGRTVKVIDAFYPSSKECSICHHINKELKLVITEGMGVSELKDGA